MPKVDPVAFAVLLPTLHAAHNLADHVVQTDHQAANKARSWRAMAGHVGGYQVTQAVAVAAVLRATGIRVPRWRLLAGMAVSAATHAFLDRRWPVLALLARTGSPAFAQPTVRTLIVFEPDAADGEAVGPLPLHGPYLADQALHHGCLALAALVMASRR